MQQKLSQHHGTISFDIFCRKYEGHLSSSTQPL